ncbi:MAG: histidine kinase N-terminal domain-containing protein, partial [Chloroflexi bacterium]|nr:histidine kinase N-terminal domain-containing protein [Chloroflexota bacterium]
MTTLPIPDEFELGLQDRERLTRIVASLPLLADLSRSDILLYIGDGTGPATIIAQARPHSVSPIFRDSLVGQSVSEDDNALLFRALRRGRPVHDTHDVTDRAIPSFQETYPVRSHDGERVVGALGLVTNLLEYERHRRRNPVFQQALDHLQQMTLLGQLCPAATLSLFGEHDGIMVIDAAGVIRYVSGIATNLYRKIGHGENLVDTAVASLPVDAALFQQALDTGQCLEQESEEEGFIWIKKAIPIREGGGGV